MKKLFLILFVALALVACPAFATPAPTDKSGNITEVPGMESAGSGGEGAPLKTANTGSTGDIRSAQETSSDENIVQNLTVEQIRERIQEKVENLTQLKDSIAAKKQQLQDELEGLRAELKQLRENQNRVRTAVHALLSMENLTGGIGKNVSAIARDFNNSIQSRGLLEERIQNRNFIVRMLFGGDEVAAAGLAKELNISDEKLANLQLLHDQCNCTADVKAELKSQIDDVEAEQARLKELVRVEKADKGWFGWLYK